MPSFEQPLGGAAQRTWSRLVGAASTALTSEDATEQPLAALHAVLHKPCAEVTPTLNLTLTLTLTLTVSLALSLALSLSLALTSSGWRCCARRRPRSARGLGAPHWSSLHRDRKVRVRV